jgi:hypothetical protein
MKVINKQTITTSFVLYFISFSHCSSMLLLFFLFLFLLFFCFCFSFSNVSFDQMNRCHVKSLLSIPCCDSSMTLFPFLCKFSFFDVRVHLIGLGILSVVNILLRFQSSIHVTHISPSEIILCHFSLSLSLVAHTRTHT